VNKDNLDEVFDDDIDDIIEQCKGIQYKEKKFPVVIVKSKDKLSKPKKHLQKGLYPDEQENTDKMDLDELSEHLIEKYGERRKNIIYKVELNKEFNKTPLEEILKNIVPLYPCKTACEMPREKRSEHTQNCPICKELWKRIEDTYIKGNKWLDEEVNE